jgi:hypothetical protein
MAVLAFIAYIAFCLLVLWGSLRQKSRGWRAGLLFAFLALTIPLWLGAMYGLFLLLSGGVTN